MIWLGRHANEKPKWLWQCRHKACSRSIKGVKQEAFLEEGSWSLEVKEVELVRWPGEERAPLQTERHMLSQGDTRGNGVLRSHK